MRTRMILGALVVVAPVLSAQERPADWKVRFDNPNADMAALHFVTMAPGWHLTTGPAGILYNPENRAEGRYRLSSTVFLFDPGRRHREAYGVFFGGSDLDGANQAYSYFLIRDTGEFLVKTRRGASTETVVPWTASDAIMQYPGGDDQAKNVLAVECGTDSVEFYVNDRKVTSVPRSRLMTDGIVGLRVNHSLNLHVSELLVEPSRGGNR